MQQDPKQWPYVSDVVSDDDGALLGLDNELLKIPVEVSGGLLEHFARLERVVTSELEPVVIGVLPGDADVREAGAIQRCGGGRGICYRALRTSYSRV